jgi:hypothetical protein
MSEYVAEILRRRLEEMLGPYHAVTAASRMNLITLPELRALCFQRRRQRPRSEGIERLMITIAHRWEEQQFLVKSSGFHLKFMQALLRIRWESDGGHIIVCCKMTVEPLT